MYSLRSFIRKLHNGDDNPALLLWIVSLSTVSISLKILLLQEVYFDGFLAAADMAMGSESSFLLELMLPVVFAWDVLECVLLVGGVYLLSRSIRFFDFNRTMLVAAVLFMALVTANYLSFRELHSGMTLGNLGIAMAWSLANPDALMPYLRKKYIIAGAAGALWAAYPYLAVRYLAATGVANRTPQTIGLKCLKGLLWATPVLVLGGILPSFQIDFMRQWWWAFVALAVAAFLIGGFCIGPLSRAARPSLAPRRGWALSLVVIVFVSLGYAAAGSATLAHAPFFFQGQGKIVVESLMQSEKTLVAEADKPQSQDAQMAAYRTLAFPNGATPQRAPSRAAFAEAPRARHVIFISFETAPALVYPIIDNPAYPTFQRMSAQAILGSNHHTTAVETFLADYSMLTGLYPALDLDYDFTVTDGLPAVLGAVGYETSYIDAYELNWAPGKQPARMLETVKFQTLLDRSDAPEVPEGTDPYLEKLAVERWAFEETAKRVIDAASQGHKAFVFTQSAIGHYPWPARAADANRGGEEKLQFIAQDLEQLMAKLLQQLDEAGLAEEVIIVVTGDHGFRIRGEFASVGLRIAFTEASFNVPLIVYAPGLFKEPLRTGTFSSHIDLAPTILELLGMQSERRFYHGMSLLDSRLVSRVTFLFNETTMPINGYHWNGYYFTSDNLTKLSTLSRDFSRLGPDILPEGLSKFSDVHPQLSHPDSVIADAKATIRHSHSLLSE